MKKIIALLLSVAMCVTLMACGSEEVKKPSQDTPQDEQIENLIPDGVAAVIIDITINPQFKIHVDNKGNVFQVECLNADAQAVVQAVNITGKSCKDGVALLIGETANQGFLKNGGELKVSIQVAEEIANQLDTWNATVMDGVTQALTEKNLNAELIFHADVMQIPQNGAKPDSNQTPTPPNGNETLPPPEPGQSLAGQTVVDTDDIGNVITSTYDENGDLSFRLEEEINGSVKEMFYQNGVLTNQKHTFMEGQNKIRMEIEFGANEVILLQQRYENDVLRFEEKFNANGTLVGENAYADGLLVYEKAFYDNGNPKSDYIYKNGNISGKIEYHENGAKSYEYHRYDNGGYGEVTYDASGNRLTEVADYGDGEKIETTYNPDGTSYQYYYNPDGTVWYSEFDAAGNQLLETHKQVK